MVSIKCYNRSIEENFFIMLTGNTLIDTIIENNTADDKTLAKKCGYATVTKSGKEKILFTPFYEAVLIAKGIIN